MIRLEVVSLVPTSYGQCAHCEALYDQSGIGVTVHKEIMQEYPPDLVQDYVRLSFWVEELAQMLGASGEAAYRSAEEILEQVASRQSQEAGSARQEAG